MKQDREFFERISEIFNAHYARKLTLAEAKAKIAEVYKEYEKEAS